MVVDVAIDQGGCFETSHATTHAEPVYLVDGVVHYCVANAGRGAAHLDLRAQQRDAGAPADRHDLGWRRACRDPPARGLNVVGGRVTPSGGGQPLGLPCTDALSLLG